MFKIQLSFIFIFLSGSCLFAGSTGTIKSGAERSDLYLPELRDKQIALVANHSSLVGELHLVDFLIGQGISKEQILTVFAPEHGFRGKHAAGAEVKDGLDPLTGIPVTSLYGASKKPSEEDLKDVDLVVFDLQDVGVRFYTYISTLHLVMEACAEHDIPLLVLDRPNPNGGYVDGPVLDPEYKSFVGMHPIPVVYGLTIGELARMIKGEHWLDDGLECRLTVVPCKGYSHGSRVELPVAPSPNLNNPHAIALYPATCFFEGTVLSEGRGTPWPFEVFGHPKLQGNFIFTPESIPGVANHPKWENEICRGSDLRGSSPGKGWEQIPLRFLLEAYRDFPEKDAFFTSYFDTLAGTDRLRKQIEAGWTEDRIRLSWEKEINAYKQIRRRYLIYE